MSNQNKRVYVGKERSNDEIGGGRRPGSLSPPSSKKVKKDQDDTESLERMTRQNYVNTIGVEIVTSDDDLDEDPFDDPDSNNCTLSTDDVFKRIGLSQNVRDFYKNERNISNLYDWQKKCLTDPGLLNGNNCIISLKTGGGKTLLAELLMLRESIVKNRSCLIILPYKAIVREIIINMSAFEELEIFTEEYTCSKGRIPPVKRTRGQNIYVATIEKATILIDSLIRENRLKEEIGLFVVDGLHMIGEEGRGAALEKLIFKYLMLGSGQIIGMSSTLGPVGDMRKFLKARLFSSDFGPFKVVERVKISNNLYNVNDEGDLIPYSKMEIYDKNRNVDSDGIFSLVKDIAPQKSVLIFCPSRNDCKYVCLMVATHLSGLSGIPDERRQQVIDLIKNGNGGKIDEVMEIGIRAGVAYHHAGLTDNARHCIETAFREGNLYALCATTTLSEGVNLPVQRVIIYQPKVGIDFLEKSRYIQMIGRAGREGYENEGESITIVGEEYIEKFLDMLKSPLKPCQSQMLDKVNLEGFIMDLIYLKLVKNVEELRDSLLKTLAGIQDNDECLSLMEGILESLKTHKIVKIENGVIQRLYH
uniref:Helicase POLQ-like n=1 Tax=Strongyloides papillosus TaxID=174720 RepID=A0A0N5BTB5_STREA